MIKKILKNDFKLYKLVINKKPLTVNFTFNRLPNRFPNRNNNRIWFLKKENIRSLIHIHFVFK
jgi:hypothetical protein